MKKRTILLVLAGTLAIGALFAAVASLFTDVPNQTPEPACGIEGGPPCPP